MYGVYFNNISLFNFNIVALIIFCSVQYYTYWIKIYRSIKVCIFKDFSSQFSIIYIYEGTLKKCFNETSL